MRIQFPLFLLVAFAVLACNDAPATAENQPENPPPTAVQTTGTAAEEQPPAEPGTAQPAAKAESEPATQPTPKPAARSVAVKSEEPAILPSKPQPEGAPDQVAPDAPPKENTVKTIEKQQVAKVEKPGPASEPKPAAPQPPSHETWDQLLQKYVSTAGKVNYTGLKKDKAKLESYLDILQKNPPQNDWSRAEKMAFWINAYNAFTVKLIVDNYPLSSIMKLDGGKPWDKKWINIGGKTYTLNNIENDILRPQFKDPRIHFAVNCAAKSCPPLLNRAWTAANLESNFEKQAKAFVNNPAFNKIGAKEVEVSKIFEWYAADFGNLVEYLNQYSNTKINANAKVKYREYDWALNE